MKKWVLTIPAVAAGFFLMALQGCFKDSCKRKMTYTYYQPVYKTTAEVRANVKSNAPRSIEMPGKLYVKGNYIFLNEKDKGIHIIDNSNPSNPVNSAFIDIPGNIDLAVKGNTLYADLYSDLIAIDITNPRQARLAKVVENVFPDRYYYSGFVADTTRVIASWEKRDTTVTEDCNNGGWFGNRTDVFMAYSATASGSGSSVSAAPYGVGGSMARFTIASDRLYTVGTSELKVFDITTSENPAYVTKRNVGMNIETIYPFLNKLFIGSQAGMYMYSITNPDNPVQAGQFNHVRSCDPVIADNDYAYVTLRSGSSCQGFDNELDVLRLNGTSDPALVKLYKLTNPHGLSKDGSTLFICDGRDGLKVFNASDPLNLQPLQTIGGIETYDVIAFNKIALVVASDGLYQYDYSNPASLRQLSRLGITKQ